MVVYTSSHELGFQTVVVLGYDIVVVLGFDVVVVEVELAVVAVAVIAVDNEVAVGAVEAAYDAFVVVSFVADFVVDTVVVVVDIAGEIAVVKNVVVAVVYLEFLQGGIQMGLPLQAADDSFLEWAHRVEEVVRVRLDNLALSEKIFYEIIFFTTFVYYFFLLQNLFPQK